MLTVSLHSVHRFLGRTRIVHKVGLHVKRIVLRTSFVYKYETLLNDMWFHKGGKPGADVLNLKINDFREYNLPYNPPFVQPDFTGNPGPTDFCVKFAKLCWLIQMQCNASQLLNIFKMEMVFGKNI